jgi:FMN phosphatase YigB (HAD superfamily)
MDFVVAAEDVRSYKPGHAHFRRYVDEFGEAATTIHVAQSLYHDGVPTGSLGIPYVWINRYDDHNSTAVKPLGTFASLSAFADAACPCG